MFVDAYRYAIRDYYGVYIGRPKHADTPTCMLKAMELSYQLEEYDVTPDVYVREVVSVWKPWFERGFGLHVPYAFLFSEKAWERFVETASKETVYLPTLSESVTEELIECEVQVVTGWVEHHRNGRAARLRDVVEEMRDLLNPAWLALYESEASRMKLIVPALERLAMLYGVPDTSPTYTSLLGKVLRKRPQRAYETASTYALRDAELGSVLG